MTCQKSRVGRVRLEIMVEENGNWGRSLIFENINRGMDCLSLRSFGCNCRSKGILDDESTFAFVDCIQISHNK